MVCLLRVDEPVAAHRAVSRAKKAAAFREDLALLAQLPYLTAQPAEFLPFGAGQPIIAAARIQVGLL